MKFEVLIVKRYDDSNEKRKGIDFTYGQLY